MEVLQSTLQDVRGRGIRKRTCISKCGLGENNRSDQGAVVVQEEHKVRTVGLRGRSLVSIGPHIIIRAADGGWPSEHNRLSHVIPFMYPRQIM
jgi:hypothetical protein